jgi:hypothetical protein
MTMSTELEKRAMPRVGHAPPPLPPVPSQIPKGIQDAPVLDGWVNPDATGIKRYLMILGIVAGFFFYVIPGIFAIRTYRQWRRGQAPTPIGWMIFGVAWISLVVLLEVFLYSGGQI